MCERCQLEKKNYDDKYFPVYFRFFLKWGQVFVQICERIEAYERYIFFPI